MPFIFIYLFFICVQSYCRASEPCWEHYKFVTERFPALNKQQGGGECAISPGLFLSVSLPSWLRSEGECQSETFRCGFFPRTVMAARLHWCHWKQPRFPSRWSSNARATQSASGWDVFTTEFVWGRRVKCGLRRPLSHTWMVSWLFHVWVRLPPLPALIPHNEAGTGKCKILHQKRREPLNAALFCESQ